MRDPKPEEIARLKPLFAELREANEALQKKQALYLQAVTAAAFVCGVPPGNEIILDEPTWRWHRVIGRGPDGSLLKEPAVSTAAKLKRRAKR